MRGKPGPVPPQVAERRFSPFRPDNDALYKCRIGMRVSAGGEKVSCLGQ